MIKIPHAVTHVLVAIVLLELYRRYFVKNKEAFPLHYIIIGGIAALIPDLDIALFYLLSFFGFTINEVHRTFSHTLFLPLLFFILAGASYSFKSKKLGRKHLKLRNIFLVIGFGILVHLILDATLIGKIMPFFPLSDYSFGLNIMGFFPTQWHNTIMPSLDAVVLIAWLISLEIRHKISRYI